MSPTNPSRTVREGGRVGRRPSSGDFNPTPADPTPADPAPLTLTHLSFDCVATTTIKLGMEGAGDALRNALASVMLRTVCPEQQRGATPTPAHAAICPACWLLAANADPGEVRRAYSLVPPLPPRDIVEPGERFSFVLTLYGQGFDFLPYFVLAVPEVGRTGIGPGRGHFELESISAVNPFTRQKQEVLAPGERLVRVPNVHVTGKAVTAQSAVWMERLHKGRELQLRFLTPMRLIHDEHLVKVPDFGVLFQRLLDRIDRLGQQFAGAPRRSKAERERLLALADRVRLMEAQTRWIDFHGWSGRRGARTPLSGFVGWATYRSHEWEPLLPVLLWGQATQAGKLAVKGNGVYEVQVQEKGGYWTSA